MSRVSTKFQPKYVSMYQDTEYFVQFMLNNEHISPISRTSMTSISIRSEYEKASGNLG
jgi:hypothetical protein